MSRFRHDAGDDGFSLIEVMVAMLIFAVLAVASLGFVMTSLSATALARTDAVGKNLNQQLLESMRNLPFSAHANVSTVPDLLDIYYTTTSSLAAGSDASGFVPAGAARDIAKGDPPTGAFYRRVLPAPADYSGYTRRVAAQFLRDSSSLLANPVFESASTGPSGRPPASAIAVRVTTLWTSAGKPRALTIESQIAEAVVKAPLVTLQARLSMLRFSGVLPDARELIAEAGVINLDGSLSSTTVASASVQAAQAGVANGAQVTGAAGAVAAPPTAARAVAPLGPQTLTDGGTLAAFTGTTVAGLAVSTDGGLPGAGTAAQPVAVAVTGNGLGGDYFQATNRPTSGSRLGTFPGHVVRGSASSCGGSCEAVRATGSLVSTGGAAHSATASLGGALAGAIVVMPTAQSPDGIVRVTLSALSARCRSTEDPTPTATVEVTYEGTVVHRTYDPVTHSFGYSAPVRISSDPAVGNDPLAGISLSTLVGVDSSGAPLQLSDYVQSWSSLSSAALADASMVATDGTAAGMTIPGVFTLTSTPLRADPVSTFGLQLGALTCTAADIR